MDIKLKAKMAIHNRFDVEVIDAQTGEMKQKAVGYNVILNRLWDTAMNDMTKAWFGAIFYGSGSGTPSASDTALFNHVGAKWVVDSGSYYNDGSRGCTYSCDDLNGVISCRRSIQLSETEAVGVTLTEVGIGYGTTSTHLCTHAMLQDMNGNPISIAKTNTDIINIYATVYIHHNQIGRIYLQSASPLRGFLFGTKCWDNNTANNRQAALGTSAWQLGKEAGASNAVGYYWITWTKSSQGSVSWSAANKKFTCATERMAVAQNNAGGIGYFGLYQIEADGWTPSLCLFTKDFYPGDDIVGEAVGTGDGSTKRFKLKFDFPENAKVYVDGVLQTSGVTVRRVPCNTLNNINAYMQWLRWNSTDAKNLVMPRDAWSTDYNKYSDGTKVAMTKDKIMRNTLQEVGIGFASVTSNSQITIWGSNDLSNWTQIYSGVNTSVNLNSTTGHFKYYKTSTSSPSHPTIAFTPESEDWKAIVFDEAPANGAVITCDYHTPYIAKDSDHVFDFSYEIQFGEYTE